MNQSEIKLTDYLDIAPSQSMSDRIFNQFSGLIIDGTLPEGYTFPNEPVLCEQLHVGRTSLREAYKALELSGYVTRTKRGTVVNGKSAIIGAIPLKVSLEKSSKRDFTEFRIMLETEAARLAAQRATKRDLDGLEHLLEQIAEARGENRYEDMNALDQEFHKTLAEVSKNKLLLSTMIAMGEAWKRETALNFSSAAKKNMSILDEMTVQHRNLVEALRKKDPDMAAAIIKNHIQHVSR